MPTEATKEDRVADVAEDVEEEVVRLFFFFVIVCLSVAVDQLSWRALPGGSHTFFLLWNFLNFFLSVEREALTVDHLSRRALSGLVSRNSLHL